jgi:hypothetical protein
MVSVCDLEERASRAVTGDLVLVGPEGSMKGYVLDAWGGSGSCQLVVKLRLTIYRTT